MYETVWRQWIIIKEAEPVHASLSFGRCHYFHPFRKEPRLNSDISSDESSLDFRVFQVINFSAERLSFFLKVFPFCYHQAWRIQNLTSVNNSPTDTPVSIETYKRWSIV